MTSLKLTLIRELEGALRDLIGLVPEGERHYADPNIRKLQTGIHALSEALNAVDEIKAKMFHFNEATERAVARMEAIDQE